MSLRDVDAIDYIGMNILFKRVSIGIFDDLDWRNEKEHQDRLTKKIDHYIRYLRSGELLLNYPKARRYEIMIEYVSMHTMTPSAQKFWESRERLIRASGFSVRMRGVDVRRSLGINVVEPMPVDTAPVEPAAIDVLDPEPRRADVTEIALLAPVMARPPREQHLPVLSRLSLRRAATN